MKKYIVPSIEVIELNIEGDVLTMSGTSSAIVDHNTVAESEGLAPGRRGRGSWAD